MPGLGPEPRPPLFDEIAVEFEQHALVRRDQLVERTAAFEREHDGRDGAAVRLLVELAHGFLDPSAKAHGRRQPVGRFLREAQVASPASSPTSPSRPSIIIRPRSDSTVRSKATR
jgi:hypothetical protein